MSRASESNHLRVLRCTSHFLGAACLAVISFATVRGYLLLAEERTTLDERHGANLAVVAVAEDLEKTHRESLGETEILLQRLSQLKLQHPDSMHEAEFLALLSAQADAVGVIVRDFRKGSNTVRGAMQEIELTLSATGTYGDLCRFLDRLGQLPRICAVRHFTLTAPQAVGGGCAADLRLSLLCAPAPTTDDQKGAAR